jgi:prepilin signal peptidase PulO-like enzyme (type II secretory pathway)
VRIPPFLDLALAALFSGAVLLLVLVFAAIDPQQRSLSSLLVGLVALLGLGASVFGILLRGVDERLERVSEYHKSRLEGGPSTLVEGHSGSQAG